jgi:hypothetical protein
VEVTGAGAAAVAVCLWSGLVGWLVGRRKGLGFGGFVAGAALGPFGWLLVLLACRPRPVRLYKTWGVVFRRRL